MKNIYNERVTAYGGVSVGDIASDRQSQDLDDELARRFSNGRLVYRLDPALDDETLLFNIRQSFKVADGTPLVVLPLLDVVSESHMSLGYAQDHVEALLKLPERPNVSGATFTGKVVDTDS